ncbi:hypothetical protein D9758_017557 [Tetrapyrgos nigripes]|uniref:Uncharacterized protein n=1 Tax=Tetrapyrgos nigripes TaxID=182062 RepID=A0A8H5C4P5_9AGAR|nr:hypothetical protein D9758_017557 [Tetrapyrgos nigripes]
MSSEAKFKLLKGRSKKGNLNALHQLGDLASSNPSFYLEALPIYMQHLPLKTPGTSYLKQGPTESHLLAIAALSGIGKGALQLAERTSPSPKMQPFLRQYWPRMWLWISHFTDAYLQTSSAHADDEEPLEGDISRTTARLLAALTRPPLGILDQIFETSGVVKCVVDLWVRAARIDIFDFELVTYYQLTFNALQASRCRPPSEMQPILEDAFDRIDCGFSWVVTQGLITCARGRKVEYEKIASVLGYLETFAMFSPKFRLVFMYQRSIHWVTAIFRKLVSRSPARMTYEDEDRIIRLGSQSLRHLNEMIFSCGHYIVVDLLRNRFLLSLLQAVPYLFVNVPESLEDSEVEEFHKPYFELMENLGAYGNYLSVQKILYQSMEKIENEGSDECFLEDASFLIRSLWNNLKRTAAERHALRRARKEWLRSEQESSTAVQGAYMPVFVAEDARNITGGTTVTNVEKSLKSEMPRASLLWIGCMTVTWNSLPA